MTRSLVLAGAFAWAAWAQPATFPFHVDRAGEAVAGVVMTAVNADWASPGREAPMADVRLDGRPAFQIMLWAGETARNYSVFLGRLEPGDHRIVIEQNRTYSAPGTSFRVTSVAVRSGIDDPVIARAPVLYARKNTIGKFTDVPLLVYAEKSPESLQYTVIFTNEDGGTSTRALMARWGRTTDIEYVYRQDLKTGRAIIQGRGHKDAEYKGQLAGEHPLLIPVTDNNMVGDEGTSEVRYQIAPVLVDLSAHSREQVMDDDPLTYAVMAKELDREAKLRLFGVVDEHKISDVRNYLYIEAKVAVENAGVVTLVRRKDDGIWRASALGRHDYSVDRDGWIRTTIELPPGTRPRDLAEIGFTCAVMPDSKKVMPLTGTCRVDAVSKVFFLDQHYHPGPSLWSMHDPVEIPAGLIRTYPVSSH
jgi:hypothetical protein